MPTTYHPGEGYYDENDPSTVPGTPEYIARHEGERAAREQSGSADLSAVEEIDFVDGENPAMVALVTDADNYGSSDLGVYPVGGGTSVGIVLYNSKVTRAGGDTGGGTYMRSTALTGGARSEAGCWSTGANASFGVLLDATDGNHFAGFVVVVKDATASGSRDAIVVGSPAKFKVLHDGRIVGANGNALHNTAASPGGGIGSNGDWALAADGHLYFKTGGAWVEKV